MERISQKGLDGIIKVREWPNWLDHNDETFIEYRKWRMSISEQEWDRYTAIIKVPQMRRNIFTHQDEWNGEWVEADAAHNLVTTLGISAILSVIGNSVQTSLQVVGQIFSMGNGAISGVTRSDTAVAGDGFGTNARRQPQTLTITGFVGDTGIAYLAGDANGTITNVGYYGWKYSNSTNATTTAGTGQLNSHSMFLFTKGAVAVTVDYLWQLSN